MKNLILILSIFFYNSYSQSTKNLSLNAEMKGITIFLNGAEINRTVKTNLEKAKYNITVGQIEMDRNFASWRK